MLPKLIYFDKNIFNAVKRSLFGGSGEYELIRRSIKAGIIAIPVSLTILEETMPIYRCKSTTTFMLEKQVFSELIRWDLSIKQHDDLILEEIDAYLNDRESNPFTDYAVTPDDIFTQNPKHIEKWKAIENETGEYRRPILEDVRASRLKYLDLVPRKYRSVLPFSLFWEAQILDTLEKYIERYGFLDQCKSKGLDELLNFRAIRLAAGYDLAYFYQKFILEDRILSSDPLDHHHVALTSATDIFITNDERLAKILALIPMEKYTVWSFRQFIGWLDLFIEGYPVLESYYKRPWRNIWRPLK
jgi:hypothetical protein